MPVDLDDLAAPAVRELDQVAPIDLDASVADPGVAPFPGQSRAPDSMYTGVKPPVRTSAELRRVMALPRRPQLDPDGDRARALVQLVNARYRRARTTSCACRALAPKRFDKNPNACITSLNVAQAWTLYEAGIQQGWLGAIGVGHGKTLINVLGALALCDAWAYHERRRTGAEPARDRFSVLLLLPPGLQNQLRDEYLLVAEHFRVPALVFHKKPWRFDVAGEPVLHVMPYSALSRPDATTFMRVLSPNAVIADEAHQIANVESTRGGRVWSYMKDLAPATRGGMHTGSLTDSATEDYAGLADMCLRERSPVPRPSFRDDAHDESGFMVCREWDSALSPDETWKADPGELMTQLIATGCCLPGEHVYTGFHRRLVETPGFIATRDSAVSCGLEIVERLPEIGVEDVDGDHVPNTPRPDPSAPDGEGWPGVRDCLNSIRDGVRPDGEELFEDGQFAIARCAREMACGFFYRHVFPRGEPAALVKDWRAKRKAFRKAVKQKLKRREEHLDSPFLLKLAAMRCYGDIPRGGVHEVLDEETGLVRVVDTSHLPEWDSDGTWPDWRDVERQVVPETEPVWVDDFLAADAAEWAHEHRGVVWYDMTAFGRKVAKLGKLRMHGGGPEAPFRLVGGEFRGRVYPGEDGKESIVCSIPSHGTGRNGLQYLFDEMLVANPPASNEGWEQLLGRLHRIGQASPVVRVEFYRHTDEMSNHVDKALRRALYVSSTLGSCQKLRVGFGLRGADGLE